MKSKNKKILVVGGTGFIGYHLIKRLTKINKYDISSISTKNPRKLRKINNVRYLICDISKKKKLETILKNKKFNFVINLGGYVDHGNSKKTFESHYTGCQNLIKILLSQKINKFIQIGSSVEYGRHKSPQKEEYKISPKSLKSVYGRAKLGATNLLLNYYKTYNFPAVILRLYITYGPKQDINRFIPIIINACIKKKEFPCSEGTQLRDFIFIDDLIKIIIKCLNTKKIEGQIFNVGTGKPKKIKDIISFIKKKTNGGTPKFGEIKFRKDEILKLYPNVSKLKKYLNWKPKISFQEGLTKTINYYNKIN